MHDQILVGLVVAVPLLLVAWYANRMRHPARSFLGLPHETEIIVR